MESEDDLGSRVFVKGIDDVDGGVLEVHMNGKVGGKRGWGS